MSFSNCIAEVARMVVDAARAAVNSGSTAASTTRRSAPCVILVIPGELIWPQ